MVYLLDAQGKVIDPLFIFEQQLIDALVLLVSQLNLLLQVVQLLVLLIILLLVEVFQGH